MENRVFHLPGFVVVASVMSMTALAQAPTSFPRSAEMSEADYKVVLALEASGSKVERSRVVVWFDPMALPESEQERWADLINKGVSDLEAYTGLKCPPGRLDFYVSDGVPISHTRPQFRRLFIALRRARMGAVPYIHETAHYLIRQHSAVTDLKEPFHVWMIEGSASYLEDAVVERFGGVAGKVFTQGGNAGVDKEAADFLKTSKGQEIVAFVGRPGAPADLGSDRENVAKPFYVMGQSLTKFIVSGIGTENFIKKLLPYIYDVDLFNAHLRDASGKSLESLRGEWLTALGFAPKH